jgi:hypothetical protein
VIVAFMDIISVGVLIVLCVIHALDVPIVSHVPIWRINNTALPTNNTQKKNIFPNSTA